jgi:putative methyltransferase (TIGR04325 family)
MTTTIKPGETFHIWEGIYDSYQAAAADAVGPGFSGDTYRSRSLTSAQECLAALQAGRPIPVFHKQRSTLLPVTVAMMLNGRDKLKVLDFGGGLGIGYMTLAESMPDDLARIEYNIVELPEVAGAGRELHGGAVRYLSELPSSGIDLVHSASALQYVGEWESLLAKLAEPKPEYMLLSDVFAGPITSFGTLQNYYGSRIPHWFLNLQELLDGCARIGYRLAMKNYATSRRLAAEDFLPMENFPASHRLAQTLHLLLRRER